MSRHSKMKSEMKNLIKTFESDLVGQQKFNAFLQHCFYSIKNPKKKSHSKKIINKYDNLRTSIVKYILAHEKEIKLELSK